MACVHSKDSAGCAAALSDFLAIHEAESEGSEEEGPEAE